jgi:hypothetical protein
MRIAKRLQVTMGSAAVLLGLINGVSAADLSQAVVRQKVNIVSLAPSMTEAPHPAAEGAVVKDDAVVRTGGESRAELAFPDQTLARLGSNSIFSFDANARALTCDKGAVLFSKPTSSGRVEVRTAAVTAAITGSTGFVSVVPAGSGGKRHGAAAIKTEPTTMMGMLEGKLRGNAIWHDSKGGQHNYPFAIGAGEMLVAQAGRPPVVVQFDLPRFIHTSPLIKGFTAPLLNLEQLEREQVEYRSLERRGFIEATDVMVTSQPSRAMLVSNTTVSNHDLFDAGVDQLGSHSSQQNTGGGGFVNVGGTGILRGQLVWDTSADLDLHLVLPDEQQVFFGNRSVTFNNGRGTAALDHDNLGHTVDVPPNTKVENIVVDGVPSNGTYNFFVQSFSSPNTSDPFTLRVRSPSGTQTINGSLAPGQNSTSVNVTIPPGG